MKNQKYTLLLAGLLFSALLGTAGCEQTFEPIQENDQYPFSIHGYLDASAGNNWVRVTEVRDTLFMGDPNSSIDAVVTLEDLESEEMVIMKDSLHKFAEDIYSYNFWTDLDIEPEKTYRLTSERSDGVTSSATVTTPLDFPDPMIKQFKDRSYVDTLVIQDVQHLADVVVTYYVDVYYAVSPISYEFDYRHIADTLENYQPDTKVLIKSWLPLDYITRRFAGTPFNITNREVKISSAGPGWRYFSSIDDNLISLPEGTSNIENGTGYLVGVVSKTIPYEGLSDHLTEPPDLP